MNLVDYVVFHDILKHIQNRVLSHMHFGGIYNNVSITLDIPSSLKISELELNEAIKQVVPMDIYDVETIKGNKSYAYNIRLKPKIISYKIAVKI